MFRRIESDNEKEAAFDGAEWLLALLHTRLQEQERVTLFVSGGQSPTAIFEHLATFNLPWSRVDLHLVDERWAPDQPEEHNETLVRTHLLQGKAASAHFHSLRLDADFQRNLQRCNEAVASIARPDVVLLGMGLDGHTASLFPDAPDYAAALTAHDRYVAVHPQQAPHPRISMSLPWIQSARQLVLFIPGKEKRELFNRIIKQGQPESPLPRLVQGHEKTFTVISTRERRR